MAEHAGFDLLPIRNFFDPQTCAGIIDRMRTGQTSSATVYTDSAQPAIDERVRRVSRVVPPDETATFVRQSLLDRKSEIGKHFGIRLSDCEEPHFLCYGPGDFFVAHQDGNTRLIRSRQDEFRKISVTIFLNSQSAVAEAGKYCGGALVFHRLGFENYSFQGEAGTLVAFPSETTHEVLPVTHGQRYAIACWYG